MTLQSVESALKQNREAFGEKLLIEEWNRLGPAELYYQVIRDGLMRVFKLLEDSSFAKEHGASEWDTVKWCQNARMELRFKFVMIATEMELRLQLKFSAYGLRRLSGDPKQVKSKESWKESIDRVNGWVQELRRRKKWYDFLDIDNVVLFRMQMIHNQLYFIKDQPALKQIPLKEMIFCLAIFIRSIGEKVEYEELYKMIINKRNIMQFLVAITSRLNKTVDNSNGKHRQSSVIKKLRKTHRRLKQIYSVSKVVFSYEPYKEEFSKRSNAFITVATYKRFKQICGEAIKSTRDTPNLSAKLSKELEIAMDDTISFNSQYRNASSHGFHLWQQYVREQDEIYHYEYLFMYILSTYSSFCLLFVYSLHDCMRCMFGIIRRCRSIDDVRAFIRYSGKNRMDEIWEALLSQREQLVGKMNAVSGDKSDHSLSDVKVDELSKLKKDLEYKKKMIENLRKLEPHKMINTVQLTAFSQDTLWVLHRLLLSKVFNRSKNRNHFKSMIPDWKLPSTALDQYFEGNTSEIQYLTHKHIELDRESVEQWRYREKTRETLNHFTIGSNLDDQTLSNLEDELHSALSGSRNGYYQNIFDINKKSHAISKTLKGIALIGPKDSKQNKHHLKAKLEELRERDEQDLKQVFQRIIFNLQKVFTRNSCETFDLFVQNYQSIPYNERLAIEYWQLQAMEILISSEYFGDNFSVLTKSIPVLWGKSYRNALAHDRLSYGIVSDCTSVLVMVNGFVLAWNSTELDVFSKAPKFDLDGLVSVEEVGDHWIDVQNRLLNASLNSDKSAEANCLKERAEINGNYLVAPGSFLRLTYYSILWIKAHSIFDNVDPYEIKQYLKGECRQDFIVVFVNLKLFHALPLLEAIQEFKIGQPFQIVPCVGAAINFLLGSFPGSAPIISALLHAFVGLCIDDLLDVIVINKGYEKLVVFGNDITEQDLGDIFTQKDPASGYDLQIATIRNDAAIFKHIMQECHKTSRSVIAVNDLEETLLCSCAYGRLEMVAHLMKIMDLSKDESLLSECVQITVANHQWTTLEFLVKNTNTSWIIRRSIILSVIGEDNFKLVKQSLLETIPQDSMKDMVNAIARAGSKCLLKSILNNGVDLWKCSGVLGAAAGNKRPEVYSFVEKQIFDSHSCISTDSELILWYKLLNDFRTLMFLSTDKNLVRAVTLNLQVLKQFVSRISTCLGIDDCRTVKAFFFEDDSGLFCTTLPVDRLSVLEDHSITSIEKCSTLIGAIQSLPSGMTTSREMVDMIFRSPNETLQARVDLTIHCSSLELEMLEDTPTVFLENLSTCPISKSMREYLQKFPVLEAATATITLKNPVKQYRYLQVGSCSCTAEDSHQENPDLGFLLNIPAQHSVLHRLPPNTPPNLLKSLLQLGADPTTRNSHGMVPFRELFLRGPFPVELLQIIYQHCVDNNATHLPTGTHIFNIQDNIGITSLGEAIMTNNYEAVKFMLQNGADPWVAHSSSKAAILIEAIINGNVLMVQLLLGYDPHAFRSQQIGGDERAQALRMAMAINHERLVRILLEHGCGLYDRDQYGCSPLLFAIQEEKVESMQALLDFAFCKGEIVDEDVGGRYKTALQIVRELKADIAMVQMLVVYRIRTEARLLSERKVISLFPQSEIVSRRDTIQTICSALRYWTHFLYT